MFREYHPTQGRWISPDPLGGSVFNPQSLNRYAYALNNPTTLIDPLGLQANCRETGDCAEPGDRAAHRIELMEARALASASAGCTLDGLPINCGVLGRVIGAGITNVNPILVSGNTITATTVECTWSESTGRVCTSGVATFTLPDLGTALDNAYGKALGALGQFFRGRPPGQRLGACVQNNISQTTFGKVSGEKVISSGSLLVPVLVGGIGTFPVVFRPYGGIGVPTMLSTAAGTRVGQLFGLGAVGATRVGAAFAVAAVAFAFDAAATVGITAGSLANCAAEGVGP